jgi:hypothetical protein
MVPKAGREPAWVLTHYPLKPEKREIRVKAMIRNDNEKSISYVDFGRITFFPL